jgi:hypothetical protein
MKKTIRKVLNEHRKSKFFDLIVKDMIKNTFIEGSGGVNVVVLDFAKCQHNIVGLPLQPLMSYYHGIENSFGRYLEKYGVKGSGEKFAIWGEYTRKINETYHN